MGHSLFSGTRISHFSQAVTHHMEEDSDGILSNNSLRVSKYRP